MNRKKLNILLVLSLISTMIMPLKSFAVSSSSVYLLLYVNQTEAFINQHQVELDAPANVIDGKMYVPAKFLGDSLDFYVHWDADTNNIHLEPNGHTIVIHQNAQKVTVNGITSPLKEVATVVNDRLLVKLTWIMDMLEADYYYNAELNRVEVSYVKVPEGLKPGEKQNSNPVAKFTFGKSTYRIGEKIDYINLSYDVDLDGIGRFEWRNRQDAFFEPGNYTIGLQVTDSKGNKSRWFEKKLTIVDEPFMTEWEYEVYHHPVAEFLKLDRSIIRSQFLNLPAAKRTTKNDDSRKLLVSDSPEYITEHGILYHDVINGKGRLYANHVNSMDEPLKFAIVATNISDEEVVLKTTKRGEVFPSIYVNLFGHQATTEFLTSDLLKHSIVIPAGETKVFAQLPDIYNGEGINLIYDIETSGDTQITFIATNELKSPLQVDQFEELAYVRNVRGTFPVSDVHWDVDLTDLTKASKVTIGDGSSDPFITGYDTIEQRASTNYGNYGVTYHIKIDQPPKMAVMLLARGGVFRGPFLVDKQLQFVPRGGVITAFDGVQLLARTAGHEDTFEIEFTPPAGSAFPIDLIFFPLDKE